MSKDDVKYEFYLSPGMEAVAYDYELSLILDAVEWYFSQGNYGYVTLSRTYDNNAAINGWMGELYAHYPMTTWDDICIVGILVDGEPVVNAQVMFLSQYKPAQETISDMSSDEFETACQEAVAQRTNDPVMDYVTRFDKESGMIVKIYKDGQIEYVLD